MNSIKKVIILAVLFTITSLLAYGDNRVINKSTDKVYTSVQKAFDDVKDGEELFFEYGKYKGDSWYSERYGYFLGYKELELKGKNNITLKGIGSGSEIVYLGIYNCNNIKIDKLSFRGIWKYSGPNPTRIGDYSLLLSNCNNTQILQSQFTTVGLKIDGGSNHLVGRSVFTSNFEFNLRANTDILKVYNNTFFSYKKYLQIPPMEGYPSYGGFSVDTDTAYIYNNIFFRGNNDTSISVGHEISGTNLANNLYGQFLNSPSRESMGIVNGWTVAKENESNNKYVSETGMNSSYIPNSNSDFIDSGKVIEGFDDPITVTQKPDVGANENILNQYLQVSGKKIEKNGSEVKLRSIAFTNYYFKENKTKLEGHDLLNVNHHNRDSFKEVKKLGFNTIRFALNANWFIGNEDLKAWDWLKTNLDWAKEEEVYLILDMHVPPGINWLEDDMVDNNNAYSDKWVWNSQEKQTQLLQIWREIALLAKDNKWVAAYGMLNEPVTADRNGAQWWSLGEGLAIKIKNSIRGVDPYHILIMDALAGHGKTRTVRGVEDRYLTYTSVEQKHYLINDNNVIYDTHFYDPGEFTHKAAPWAGGKDDGSKYDKRTMVQVDTPPGSFWYPNKGTSKVKNKIESSIWSDYESEWFKVEDAETELLIASINVTDTDGLSLGDNTKILIDDIEIEEIVNGEVTSLRKIEVNWGNVFGAKYPVDENKNPVDIESINLDNYDFRKGIFYQAGWDSTDTDCYGVELVTLKDGSKGLALTITKKNKKENGLAWSFSSASLKVIQGNSYRIKARMKVDGSYSDSVEVGPTLIFYKDHDNPADSQGYYKPIDTVYLKDILEKSVKFSKDNNVPISCLEFGVTKSTFEPGFNGNVWLNEVFKLLDDFSMPWSFWSYRNKAMGMYGDENFGNLVSIKNDRIYEYVTGKFSDEEWKPNTFYLKDSSVLFADESYIARSSHNSGSGAWTPPVTPTLWGKSVDTNSDISIWKHYGNYMEGEFISYNGKVYRCKQTHTAFSIDWTPEITPALWMLIK